MEAVFAKLALMERDVAHLSQPQVSDRSQEDVFDVCRRPQGACRTVEASRSAAHLECLTLIPLDDPNADPNDDFTPCRKRCLDDDADTRLQLIEGEASPPHLLGQPGKLGVADHSRLRRECLVLAACIGTFLWLARLSWEAVNGETQGQPASLSPAASPAVARHAGGRPVELHSSSASPPSHWPLRSHHPPSPPPHLRHPSDRPDVLHRASFLPPPSGWQPVPILSQYGSSPPSMHAASPSPSPCPLPPPTPRPPPPVSPPTPPPSHPPPVDIVERINRRYRATQLSGAHTNPLASMGVLVHGFDSQEDPEHKWRVCARDSQCGFISDRMSASLVFKGKPSSFGAGGGVIINQLYSQVLCAYGGDGGTRGKLCHPPGLSKECVPGCTTTELSNWCEPDGLELKPGDSWCDGRPWRPEDFDVFIERNRHSDTYNEFMLDGFYWNEHLPNSIEAIIGAPGDPEVRKVHADFLSTYGLAEADVPLVSYFPENADHPFARISSLGVLSPGDINPFESSNNGRLPNTGDISQLGFG